MASTDDYKEFSVSSLTIVLTLKDFYFRYNTDKNGIRNEIIKKQLSEVKFNPFLLYFTYFPCLLGQRNK